MSGTLNSMAHFNSLARRAHFWHAKRFPSCTPEESALKMSSENGEVCDAVLGHGDVGQEAADVLITLVVLLSRWYPTVDLLAEMDKKLRLLETPGAHKSSAVGVA